MSPMEVSSMFVFAVIVIAVGWYFKKKKAEQDTTGPDLPPQTPPGSTEEK